MADDQHIEEELERLSTMLDEAIGSLKDGFKRHEEQERKHVQDLKRSEEGRQQAERMNTYAIRQIMSLQPESKGLFTDSGESAFREWVGYLTNWINTHIDPAFFNKDKATKALEVAKKEPLYGSIFSQVLKHERKFRFESRLDGAQEGIAEACIYSWLTRVIFDEGLRPVSPDSHLLLYDIERALMKEED
ncbi:hypothetical protein PG994_009346 [Apiospora phragmitis]|uniref:Uncharacterized protein n=1 Tax=Apiospora phragmitis TaxID=2905665 RepID=A0ABR1UJ17_9PEZI